MSLQFGNVQAVVLSDAKSIQEALLSSKAKSFNGRLNGPIQQVYWFVNSLQQISIVKSLKPDYFCWNYVQWCI